MVTAVLDIEMVENRSLAPRVARRVLYVGSGAMLLSGLLHLREGAWPVVAAAGVYALVFAVAWSIFARRTAPREHLVITPDTLTVEKVNRRGRLRAHFQPAWTRVEVEGEEDVETRVWLVQSGRRFEIAHCLSPPERCAVAERVQEALGRIKRGGPLIRTRPQ